MKAILAAVGRPSLSVRIITGLALGVFIGLFFGEPAAVLQPVADIYIRLMQMTVLPYLVMSLIIGFGQLETHEAKRLAVRGGLLLLLVWALSLTVIVVMPAAFPVMQSASFFSSALVEPKQQFSIADLYITSNPFHSLSNAVIPAVVLFSSMIGIGLIGLENREPVLDTLRVLNTSIAYHPIHRKPDALRRICHRRSNGGHDDAGDLREAGGLFHHLRCRIAAARLPGAAAAGDSDDAVPLPGG